MRRAARHSGQPVTLLQSGALLECFPLADLSVQSLGRSVRSLHETATTASVACVSRLFVWVAESYSGFGLWADLARFRNASRRVARRRRERVSSRSLPRRSSARAG